MLCSLTSFTAAAAATQTRPEWDVAGSSSRLRVPVESRDLTGATLTDLQLSFTLHHTITQVDAEVGHSLSQL